MRKLTAWVAGFYLLLQISLQAAHAEVLVPPVIDESRTLNQDPTAVETEAYRSGRGGYRSPTGGYTGGDRAVNPGTGARNPGVNAPGNRTPAAPAAPGSRFGGFFGGLFAGSLLGGLLNPLGFGTGMMSGLGTLIGLLFLGVLLYLGYRMFRRVVRGRQ